MRSAVLRTALLFLFGLLLIAISAGPSRAAEQHQVVVCKYVGTPGVDERLQTGQNPIVVDSNALEGDGFDGTFPFAFSDAQGNSIAIRWAANSHDGNIAECPGYVAQTPGPTDEVAPTVAPTENTATGGGGPDATPPNTATEPTASDTPAGSPVLLLIAALVAWVLSMTMLPGRERNRR